MMEQTKAVAALAALAQDTRLSVFRLLMQAGPDGMIAGAVAEAMDVPPSTMSHHLAKLEQAGLVMSWRTSRLIHYAADYAGIHTLLNFLMADCCRGDPNACADLLSAITCSASPEGAGV
ncbi:helix-turn-helix domain-containing protein [Sphingobium sp.]|uniref:ArsR/SmtB family transcription factor n=1 Tax=Sphingobium TaxID=165695 RepID=UPI00338E7056